MGRPEPVIILFGRCGVCIKCHTMFLKDEMVRGLTLPHNIFLGRPISGGQKKTTPFEVVFQLVGELTIQLCSGFRLD